MIKKGRIMKIVLIIFFIGYIIYLYLPILVMMVLSFQGPEGGLIFPMKGVSLHWYKTLIQGTAGVNFGAAITRSLILGLLTTVVTVIFVTMLAIAFRRTFRGETLVFYFILSALVTPGILISLGVSIFWNILGLDPSWLTTGLGVHVMWALPFGFLVMLAVFNRFDASVEEAARDLGATAPRTFLEITLPLIGPGLLGAALFAFTMSWNEFDRTFLVAGRSTLPLAINNLLSVRTSPALYALGTITTLLVFFLVGIYLVTYLLRGWRR